MTCENITACLVAHWGEVLDTRPIEDGCVVVTPLAHPDMASVEFVVEPREGGYRLSDAGETLNSLFVQGVTVEGNTELEADVTRIVAAHGVTYKDSTLSLWVPADEVGAASHRLLNTIQAVSFLLYKRSHRAHRTFNDEVTDLLTQNHVPFVPNATVMGAASTHHVVAYVDSGRELLLQPITATSIPAARAKAKQLAYKWSDIHTARSSYRCVTIIDDKDGKRDAIWADREAFNPIQIYSSAVIWWAVEQPKLVRIAKYGIE